MPVSPKHDPFANRQRQGGRPAVLLRIPHARVLRVMIPEYPEDPPSEWITFTRTQLAIHAGFKPTTGTINRVLNGIPPGSSSGDAHLGLIDLGCVDVIQVIVEGVTELHYRITPDGIRAVKEFIASGKRIPEVRDAVVCTNDRYKQPTPLLL